jgi:hypothetical protein
MPQHSATAWGRRDSPGLRVADLATAYGFTDVDGRQVPPFELDP